MISQDQYNEKLKQFISNRNINAEHLVFDQSCHSVEDAAQAANDPIDAFVKNICMIAAGDKLIVAIVKGEDRASTSRVAKALQIDRPRTATPEEILERTGFPCGGTPSFGFEAVFLVDPKVTEKEVVYTGGGTAQSLVKISVDELVKANNAQVVRVRK